MNIFVTADLHFFHKKVLDYENRPFKDVEEMNEKLIENWNDTVKRKDKIYILGDFSFGKSQETLKIVRRLNGEKHLILGNHDKGLNLEIKRQFTFVKDVYDLKYKGKTFVLFHHPIYAWAGKEKGAIHLHGHVHSNSHHDIVLENKYNVGVDLWDYKPVSIDKFIIKEKEIFYRCKRCGKKCEEKEMQHPGSYGLYCIRCTDFLKF